MDRVARWTLCSCQGTSDFLGGEALDGLLAKIPMKVVINCLVRMAHASSTSLFRQRLETGIASLAKSAQRIQAFTLPQTTRDAVARNKRKLKLFSTFLDEEEVDLILSMLNADWAEPADEGLVHVCTADCCASDADFERRMTSALRAAFGGGFEVPLLYRWKGFEPAAEFAARGVGIHGLFLSLWRFCRTDAGDMTLEDIIDEDAPDSNPAFKQQVVEMNLNILTGGAGKTAIAEYWQLLRSPATANNWFADLGVSKNDSLPLLLIGVCEAWRRLVLPYTCLPWQLLLVTRMDVDGALDFAVSLQRQHCGCPRCSDPMFAEVLLAWVLADGVSATVRQKRMQRLKIILEDIVVAIPSTSVQVERQHANIQTDSAANKRIPQRAGGVQANSYVTTAFLAHKKVRSCLESEKFGVAKARIRRTMKSRCAAAPFLGLTQKRKAKITDEGTVKGRNGLLKGLLSGPHSIRLAVSVREGRVRKDAKTKTRHVSAYNVFQQECRSRCNHVKVGSLEHRQLTQMLSQEWANISPQRKQEYQLKANKIQEERNRLRTQSLQHQNSTAEAAAIGTGLRESQIKRLNGARLDGTLQQVSAHNCWRQELGIWDHNAAIRGSLVTIPSDQRDMDAMRAEYDKLFAYDPEVLGNPTSTPSFMRPCATTHAGTCIKDQHHEEYVALVAQFDAGLGNLGGSPLLVQLKVEDTGEEHWLAMAGVQIYSDLVIRDESIELPSTPVANFPIGLERAGHAAVVHRSTPSKLPFGMSSLVEPKKRVRKPQETDDDQQCGSSVKKKKLQSQADPEEAWPTVLSPEAQEELDRALAADLAALGEDEETLADAPVSEPASSSNAPPAPASAAASSSEVPASSQSTYFQKELGICDLAIVKRKGVKCFHCDDHIEKGEYRFGVAYSRSKPHRSVHLHCLAQLREEYVSNSIRFLEQHVIKGSLTRAEQGICQDALRSLRDLEPAA
ncbi:unnamed protein product [Symbiodinium sp. CCMP2592]|nr:unnamed protein product [Symbiodinium sp. CCMP2592]